MSLWSWGFIGIVHLGFIALPSTFAGQPPAKDQLLAGFAEIDITPELGKDKKPVFIAGFGQNRKATAIHDPIMARAVVLAHGGKKIALASVDLVGLFLSVSEAVRGQLPGFDYVLVSSTHNHEGPDTLGLWGPHPFQSGIDPAYLKKVEQGIIAAVRQADKNQSPVSTRIGSARAPELLHDGREPYVKHDELVALQFQDGKKNVGLVVQWNCHPETLDSKNTQLSADYVASTVKYLRERFQCPVVYLTGTVGGLMTSLRVEVKDDQGQPLKDGTFAKTERYGVLVGKLAEKALTGGQPVQLTPIMTRRRDLFLPMDNKLYQIGYQLGVLQRQAYLWNGDAAKAEPIKGQVPPKERLAVRTEVGWLKLGELEVAAIPGEIYPELVLGKVQDPADPGADFPTAPIEPSIYAQMKSKHRMLIGLANDEVGYILPKRQWDEKAPYCYGRKKSQYGEINSLGPETGPLVCEVFRAMLLQRK